jgi:ubiquinone/menaquinone biosynthesis C-methylase UbiE
VSFEELLRTRSAAAYADFALPSIVPGARVLDIGCGPGSVTVGFASAGARVVGLDVDATEFGDARGYAAEHHVGQLDFVQATVQQLPFGDASFDVCTLLSVLETLTDPVAALGEVRRVLVPGGLLAASSIDYGGLVLHGGEETLLRRFFELRLALWDVEGHVDTNRGRELRSLLLAAGFVDVEAVATYFSYGTNELVRTFGTGRAADCRDPWFAGGVVEHGLAPLDEVDALEAAWLRWGESPVSFAAFTWGRATARRP